MKKINLTLLLLLLTYLIFAQSKTEILDAPEFHCATDIEEAKQMQDPDYAILKRQKERQYREAMIRLREQREQNVELRQPPVYTLPVVVHIFHTGAELGTAANPSDASVAGEINTATQRFRHAHPSAVDYSSINALYGADTEIEFCLASTDPNGNYTTGIMRYYDEDLGFFDYDNGESVSEYYASRWPINEYLNLFIIEDLTGAAGVYFGAADATFYDSGSFWDGLIAHEVGHHLSLRHTFQSGCPNGNCLSNGDSVCDTPPKAEPGFNGATACDAPNDSCDTDDDDTSANNPYRPVANGGIGNQADMIANYMDYTGSCWDAFTQGQKDRMRNNIETFRIPLTTSSGCDASTPPSADAGISAVTLSGSACSDNITATATLVNYGTASLSSATIILKANGTTILSYSWSGNLASGASTNVVLSDATLGVGSYVISAETSSPNGSTDGFFNNDIAYTRYSVTGAATLPYSEDFESTAINTIAINPDNSSTWGLTTSSVPNCEGGSAFVNNYSYNANGQRDYLRLPLFDLSNFSSATLTFDVLVEPPR